MNITECNGTAKPTTPRAASLPWQCPFPPWDRDNFIKDGHHSHSWEGTYQMLFSVVLKHTQSLTSNADNLTVSSALKERGMHLGDGNWKQVQLQGCRYFEQGHVESCMNTSVRTSSLRNANIATAILEKKALPGRNCHWIQCHVCTFTGKLLENRTTA